MPPHDDTSSWPMLRLAIDMRLHQVDGSGGDADLRRVEEYIESYRAWAPKRDRAVARHLLESPNVYRVTIPAGPGAFDLAARSSWYFDQVIVEDPLAFLLDSKEPWTFESPPQFETNLPTQWLRTERCAVVHDRLRRLQDLHQLLASRTILLTNATPPSGNLLPWQREPARSPSPMQEKLAHQIADVLAAVEHDEGRARLMATGAGLLAKYLPKFETAAVFWNDVVDQAIRGRFLLSELVLRATAEFPHNQELAELAARLDEPMRAGSFYEGLAARVLTDPSFHPWLRSGSDLKMLDTVPHGDTSRWQFCRAELNGVYKLNVHRNEPVGPAQSVTATLPRDADLLRVDWPIDLPDVPPAFTRLIEDLVRTYLQDLGSTGAHALDSGMGILTRDRTERRLVRTILQGKALDEDPSSPLPTPSTLPPPCSRV